MVDEKEKIKCVRCSHVADDKDKYCIKCGAPLMNYCADTKRGKSKHHCGANNKRDAHYCSKCGHETIFKQRGLI
ncbi:hypothetical protein ACFSCX_12200 [Bacillus salitolerans]|uniref:DZANK-type domain-containing protein n=1 Tax=Bacillus salitolerans TaxID=1437434 RepID=A0ABW4LR21_9BACI